MNMTIAEKVKKEYTNNSVINKDFSIFGGRVVESSEWSRKFTVANWKIWRFSDRSNLLVSNKGAQVI